MKGKLYLKWIIGVILILRGILGILDKELPSVILILLGLFIIPLSYKKIVEEKANLSLTSKTKWIVSIFIFLSFIVMQQLIQKTESNGKTTNDKRNEKIELTQYYLDNAYKNVTDKDGISYHLNVEKKEVSRKKMYESEKIYKEDGLFIIVSSYKVVYDFKLTSNGDIVDLIRFEGYLLLSKRNDTDTRDEWCNADSIYFPELDSENKKELISNFTGKNCGMGEEVNNLVQNERIKAVKASGILEDK